MRWWGGSCEGVRTGSVEDGIETLLCIRIITSLVRESDVKLGETCRM